MRLKPGSFCAATVVFSLFLSSGLSQQRQYPEPKTQTEESNREMTPKSALELLKAGNERFVRGTLISRPIRQQVRETALGQFPFAAILSCQDSRTSSELLFDLNNGDAFSLKVAGNVANEDMLGGLEFGTAPLFARLI